MLNERWSTEINNIQNKNRIVNILRVQSYAIGLFLILFKIQNSSIAIE